MELMRGAIVIAAATGAVACQALAERPDADIAYEFVAADGRGGFQVTLSFEGEADGSSVVLLPDAWGPETGLTAQFSDFGLIDTAGGAWTVEAGGAAIAISHAPGAPVTLRYHFSQDYDGMPQWGDQRVPGLRPVTQPDFAVFVGAAAFAYPERDADRDAIHTVAFVRDGQALAVSSSLGDGDVITTSPVTAAAFLDTLWLVGDFSRANADLDDLTVRTAVRGDLPLGPAAFQALADGMIADASALFSDTPFQTYLIASMPLPPIPDQSAVIGTAFHQSFLLLTTPNAGETEVRKTIAHEVLHEWITGRMGPTDAESDPRRMWFTEGFTDYFSHLVRLRAGDIDLAGFLAGMAEIDASYRASPVHAMRRDELVTHIWDSHETERLPYQRGALLALVLDSELARAGEARLADVVTALIAENQAQLARTGIPLPLGDDRIAAALLAVVGSDGLAAIDRVTGEGAWLTYGDTALFGCVDAGPDGFTLAPGADAEACRAAIITP